MQAEVHNDLKNLFGEALCEVFMKLGVDESAASVAWQSYFTIPGWGCHMRLSCCLLISCVSQLFCWVTVPFPTSWVQSQIDWGFSAFGNAVRPGIAKGQEPAGTAIPKLAKRDWLEANQKWITHCTGWLRYMGVSMTRCVTIDCQLPLHCSDWKLKMTRTRMRSLLLTQSRQTGGPARGRMTTGCQMRTICLLKPWRPWTSSSIRNEPHFDLKQFGWQTQTDGQTDHGQNTLMLVSDEGPDISLTVKLVKKVNDSCVVYN